MIAYVRRLAIPAATLMALHCAPADAAHFVFTILTPPNQTGPAYVTGMYQDQAVGYTNGPDGQDYVSFVYSAGNYTILPAIPFFYGVTDSGLAFGYSANSEKAYSTYDLLSGATTTYNFAPPGNSTFAIGGMNAAGDVIATQVTSIGNNTSSCQPFEQAPDGSYTYLANLKSPTGLFGVGQTDSGVTVLGSGSCQDGHPGAPYFLVTNGKTKAFNIPNSQTVSVLFVSGDEFGGSFTDTNTQKTLGFTSKGGKVVTYTVPTAIFGTYVTGVNAQGEVVGFSSTLSATSMGLITLARLITRLIIIKIIATRKSTALVRRGPSSDTMKTARGITCLSLPPAREESAAPIETVWQEWRPGAPQFRSAGRRRLGKEKGRGSRPDLAFT